MTLRYSNRAARSGIVPGHQPTFKLTDIPIQLGSYICQDRGFDEACQKGVELTGGSRGQEGIDVGASRLGEIAHQLGMDALEMELLVHALGWPEGCLRQDLDADPVAYLALQSPLRGLGSLELAGSAGDDGGADPTGARRQCNREAIPVDVEQLLVGDEPRIEDDLHRLAMTAELMVRRVLQLATSVANSRALNPFETPEPGIAAPESPKSEDCSLQAVDARREGWQSGCLARRSPLHGKNRGTEGGDGGKKAHGLSAWGGFA